MVQGGSTTTALGASLSWLGLVVIGLVHAAGADVPRSVELAAALVAAPIAAAGAILAIAAVWRGPTIVSFSRDDAVPCTAGEAAFVRASSQLRGLIGGAGHLYPRRLVLPALAWLAAAVVGLCGLVPRLELAVGPWAVVLAFAAAFLAILFPARPYFYRDTTGGGAVVAPASAAYRLKARSELAAARARGEDLRAETPAPTPVAAEGVRAGSVERRG